MKADKATTNVSLLLKANTTDLANSYTQPQINTLLETERLSRMEGFSELENTLIDLTMALDTKKANTTDLANYYTKTEN